MILRCLAILMILGACAKKETTSPEIQVNETPQTLLVSFYSIGTGTESEAEFEVLKTKYFALWKKPVPIEVRQWGKEGEIDYCVDLVGLPNGSVNDFVEELKKAYEKRHVHFTLAQTCKQRGR